ncbi:MAG: hypothetical protein FWG69_01115 [Oscillospiraceae bacterium]|nr:hypothetical protein [Oscillospiraceae bacterium]
MVEYFTKGSKRYLKAGASTAFFTASLLYTVSMLFKAVLSFSIIPLLTGDVFAGTGDAFILSSRILVFSTPFMLIPSGLICVGMWIFCYSSRKAVNDSNNTAIPLKGMKLIRIGVVSLAAVYILLILFMLYLFANITVILEDSSLNSDIISRSVVFFSFLLFFCAVIPDAVYFLGLFKTLNAAVKTLKKGTDFEYIPLSFLVFGFILAAVKIITAIMSLIDGNPIGFIFLISESAAFAMIAVVAYSIRD